VKSVFRPRVLLSLVAALAATGGVAAAGAVLREEPPARVVAGPPRSTTTTSTTTTLPPATTTTIPGIAQPPPVDLPPVPYEGWGPGTRSFEIQAYEQRLADVKFDPGPVDGSFDQKTAYAMEAVQKLAAFPVSGRIGPGEELYLETFQYAAPLVVPAYGQTLEPNRTEVNITNQTVTLYENFQPRLISTTSTGSGENYCYNSPRENPTQRICEDANTPSGRYTFYYFYKGWHKSPLGQLYNPFYFNKGIAIHGYSEVPALPASHGCVRIPMHIAEYFYTLVHENDPVYVFGGTDANITSTTPLGGGPPAAEPPPALPPPGEPAPPPETTPPPTDPIPVV